MQTKLVVGAAKAEPKRTTAAATQLVDRMLKVKPKIVIDKLYDGGTFNSQVW
jgi:hypothetical protein